MVSNFSTLGSCSSRDIFNGRINDGYKKFAKINSSIQAITLISLMSNPLNVDQKLINSPHPFDNECVYNDLSKDFLQFLKKKTIDYLVIDTYFDVLYDVLLIDENCFLSNSERLHNTDLFNSLDYCRLINIRDNFEEYCTLWKDACNSFFSFMTNHCEGIHIILNLSRSVFKYESNNKIVVDENLKRFQWMNRYRDLLDGYILKNFDVDVLEFDGDFLSDENHAWGGLHQSHYEKKYYAQKLDQLNLIMYRNEIFDYKNEFNINYRLLKRKKILFEFNHVDE